MRFSFINHQFCYIVLYSGIVCFLFFIFNMFYMYFCIIMRSHQPLLIDYNTEVYYKLFNIYIRNKLEPKVFPFIFFLTLPSVYLKSCMRI